MSTLTEHTVLKAIVIHADGRVQVCREAQVLRDDEVIHSTAQTQELTLGADLPQGLEPEVLSALTAAWTPDRVSAARELLLSRLRETFDAVSAETKARQDKMEAEERTRRAELDELRAQNEQAAQGIARTREGIMAAHRELNDEHAALSKRNDEVSRLRDDLFVRHEKIRAAHPKLDALVRDTLAQLPTLPALGQG